MAEIVFSRFANSWRVIEWMFFSVVLSSNEMRVELPVPRVSTGKGEGREKGGLNFERISNFRNGFPIFYCLINPWRVIELMFFSVGLLYDVVSFGLILLYPLLF